MHASLEKVYIKNLDLTVFRVTFLDGHVLTFNTYEEARQYLDMSKASWVNYQ